MVFPGQKLIVPTVDGIVVAQSAKDRRPITNGKPSGVAKSSKTNNSNDPVSGRGPGHAVRTTTEVQSTKTFVFDNKCSNQKHKIQDENITSPNSRRNNTELARMASELDPDDQECLQRFLKIRVKQVTESDGTIVGTLLVTPNCLMFDPDTEHPLVQENGTDLYGMVANMEDIVSVTVYKNITSLIGTTNKKKDIFDPKNVISGFPEKSEMALDDGRKTEAGKVSRRRRSDSKYILKSVGPRRTAGSGTRDDQFLGMDDGHPLVYGTSAGGLLLNSSFLEEKNNALLGGGSTGESSLSNSEQQLPSIDEEQHEDQQQKQQPTNNNIDVAEKRRTVSDMHCQQKASTIEDFLGSKNSDDSPPPPSFVGQRLLKTGHQCNSLDLQSSLDGNGRTKRAHSDLEQATSMEMENNRLKCGEAKQRRTPSPSSPFSRYSPGMARKSFGKLGRTLSAKATSIKDTVQSGAQSVATGTQKVAHEVVTQTLSAADHIQSGIQTGAKVVASVPSSILNVSTELLQEGQKEVKEVVDQLKALGEDSEKRDQSPLEMKREKSLATLEKLCQHTQQAREQAAVQKAFDTGFVLGDEERPVPNKCLSAADNSRPIGTPPDPPYYMSVRVDRRNKPKKHRLVCVQKSNSKDQQQHLPALLNGVEPNSTDLIQEESCAFGNKRKREFWFAIPRNRVDTIYHFLLQWSPQKYGQEKASTAEETNEPTDEGERQLETTKMTSKVADGTKANKQHLSGFIVLEGEVDDALAGDKPSDHFGNLNREWEVVTVRELCRRLSLDDSLEPSEMPLPEGSAQSQMLDEFMIKQLVDILPPRAEGYPWIQIYSSEKHGFSLATLYRKMAEWNEEMSPVLMVIRDVGGHVFGAVASTALKPCDHYYGTGDSSLLFRFTGEYPHTRELRAFGWTGDNQFFVNATREFLSFGAGGGHYGLWLDADLNHGRSQKCATFDNEPLAGGMDEDFVVQFVEVFGFSMT